MFTLCSFGRKIGWLKDDNQSSQFLVIDVLDDLTKYCRKDAGIN